MPDKLEWEILKRGMGQALEQAGEALSGAADGVLDSLENRLLKGEDTSGDALERLRSHYGVEPQKGEGTPEKKEDPLLQVKAQLEALKAARAKGETPVQPAPPTNAPAKADPLAEARAQLEALKKARATPETPPSPVKRTL